MKAVSLISVGIDSPVATQIMKERGLEIIGINFSFSKDEVKDVLIKILKKIGVSKCYNVDYKGFHSAISRSERYRCIMCKRFMYMIAEHIAEKENAKFLVTGENIGQVASQTISNMHIIDSAVDIVSLRPLLCYDKNEIVAKAKEIGTFEYSILKNKRCPYVPSQPATKSKLPVIEGKEENLRMQDLIEKAIETASLIDID
jgi:tRNA uracil 4-sulfurtransferase